MFKSKYSESIGLAIISMLGGAASIISGESNHGEGYFRAQERLVKHREQWANTPKATVITRQVRRNELRRSLKDASAYQNRHFAGGAL